MLDKRKYKVLKAVIDSYIESAKPVGSNTISNNYDLGVSSATIRNEMSDLESLGYLNKPHTSAGRVPSDKAYRFYVDYILEEKIFLNDTNMIKFENVFDLSQEDYDSIIKTSTKVLSSLTSYTALIISPQVKKEKLKIIQLISLDDRQILIVLVSDLDKVSNKIFSSSLIIDQEELNKISKNFNQKYSNKELKEIYELLNADMSFYKNKYIEVMLNIRDLIEEVIEEKKELDIHTEGVNKIFDHPEYKSIEKAKSLISFIEDRDTLVKAIVRNNIDSGIEVTIGDENLYDPLKESTLITTTYSIGDRTIGKLGIVGPTRMDYLNMIGLLEVFSYNLTRLLDKIDSKN